MSDDVTVDELIEIIDQQIELLNKTTAMAERLAAVEEKRRLRHSWSSNTRFMDYRETFLSDPDAVRFLNRPEKP